MYLILNSGTNNNTKSDCFRLFFSTHLIFEYMKKKIKSPLREDSLNSDIADVCKKLKGAIKKCTCWGKKLNAHESFNDIVYINKALPIQMRIVLQNLELISIVY